MGSEELRKWRRLARPAAILAVIVAGVALPTGLASAATPAVVTEPASNIVQANATLHGTVNPEGEELTECVFEYGTTTGYGKTAPCVETPAQIGAGTSPVSVHVELAGLEPATEYHFRLSAVNATSPKSSGSDETFSTVGVRTEAASNVTKTDATLHGAVNPEGEELTECVFEYGTTTGYGETAACVETPAQIGAGTSPVSVHVELAGLEPATEYHFRLSAVHTTGLKRSGSDKTFATLGPVPTGEVASLVQDTTAKLSGTVNPNGKLTTYRFEYTDEADFQAHGFADATKTPVPDAAAGGGSIGVPVSVALSGLSPETTYHFRLVATNPDGSTAGSGATFTTYPAAASFAACPNDSLRYGYGAFLPDCRAYEQATPIDKDGTNPKSAWFAVQAAEDGSGVTFFSQAGIPGAEGAGSLPTFASFRGATGWTTRGLLPPATAGQRGSVFGWTPDLTEVFNTVTRFGTGTGVFARTESDNALHTIAPFISATAPDYNFVGASSDGSKVYIEASGVELTPGAAPGKQNLYVWDRDTGALGLAGVLPDSACGSPPCTPAGGSFGGSYNWWTNELGAFGGAEGRFFTQYQHAISRDGSKAYFTAGETGQLYLRENATSPAATTVRVSASQKTNGTGPGGTDPEGPKPAAFLAATADGSKVFFMSSEKLTNDATTGPTDEGRDLYRYEPGSGRLADLTPDAGDPNGAEVQGLVGTSTDGSYVYFAANGDLDGAGPAATGDCRHPALNSLVGGSGECSLYRWHEGDISFVARLDASGEVGGIVTPGRSDLINWAPTGREASSTLLNGGRVSADGQVVLFRSQRKLTAYDNHGVPEFYRYDARSRALDCVTCNPSGVAPSGQPNFQARTAFLQVNSWAGITTRNLSSSGDRFFFETPDALLPGDTNGVEDVYEWEADGAGSCQSRAEDGGCLYLLSTGKSPEASHLADASVSGDDVFIFTDQPLVGQDEDELVDIYDARVDGGLASQNPQRVPPCSGEGCRGSSTRAPGAQGAGTASFSGPGNVAPGGACIATRKITRLHRHAAALRHQSRALTRRARHTRDALQARRLKRQARRLSKGAQVLTRRAHGLTKRCKGAGSHRQRGSHRRGGSR